MTDIVIRPARPDEGEVLTELSMRSKQSNGYDDVFMAACRAELTVTAAKLRAGAYWVAETDRICGCAALVVDADGRGGEVHAFFVEPKMKGMGIGRRLWREVRARAEALGLRQLRLDADPHAEPFYRRLGFETVGRAPSGSIPGRTIPHMTLDLSAR